MSRDAVVLTIPRERAYHGVARLVVSGAGARFGLSYDHLDDLQLALASVLDNDGYAADADLTVRLTFDTSSITMVVGPLDSAKLRSDLEASSAEEISLHRLLSALVDTVVLEEGEGGGWLRLEKNVPLKQPQRRA